MQENRLYRFLVITFLGSFAVISIERAIYFLTAERLGFSPVANLWLALGFGVAYVSGALASHGVASRGGERRVLWAVLVIQAAVHLGLGVWPVGVAIFIGCSVAGFLYGMQWPIIESYVGAGHSATQGHRAVGMFNLSWALAIPLTLVVAGIVIRYSPRLLFWIPAILNVVMLILLRRVPASPARLDHDHPERPSTQQIQQLQRLLIGHRWLLLTSYIAMFVLAPLLPGVFARLGLPVSSATAWSGSLDVLRVMAFLLLWLFSGWHGKRWPVWASALLLPMGFFLALFGPTLSWVIAGEAVFGATTGVVYFGALHYALVVSNATVDAGGAHEGLIGAGFAIGPLVGLMSIGLAPRVGGELAASLLVLGPIFGLGGWLAIRSLRGMSAPGGGHTDPPIA